MCRLLFWRRVFFFLIFPLERRQQWSKIVVAFLLESLTVSSYNVYGEILLRLIYFALSEYTHSTEMFTTSLQTKIAKIMQHCGFCSYFKVLFFLLCSILIAIFSRSCPVRAAVKAVSHLACCFVHKMNVRFLSSVHWIVQLRFPLQANHTLSGEPDSACFVCTRVWFSFHASQTKQKIPGNKL